MSLTCRVELAVAIAVVICTCVCGMKIDFTRLSHHKRSHYIIPEKRGSECSGNPCPVDKPFLCKTSPKCVALKYVCDGTRDCEDGFDENKAMCTAASRPSLEQLFSFLTEEQDWILPKLFGGVDPEFAAHGLAVASDIDDLSMTLGLTPENVKNLHIAFQAAREGDERPLLDMNMPEGSWPEVQYLLQELLDSGFKL